jgi:N-ethylmaleimide reductase
MPNYPGMAHDYAYLAQALSATAIAYVHLVDHSRMGAPPVPDAIKQEFRRSFRRTLILSGGYDAARAEQDLSHGRADLIAVGRPVLANPDLVTRWQRGAKLNSPDMSTFYTPGPKGYVDYPALA